LTKGKGKPEEIKVSSVRELEKMVTKGAIKGTDYTQTGVFPETITYKIYSTHPNLDAFKETYDTSDMDVGSGSPSKMTTDGGGSRRRRPSRKYKKSKRVLRRKSRSTRRR
jgi:hypothetical protein